MTIVFLSNYFNHHQQPVSDAFEKRLGDNYYFIETECMEGERVSMGWQIELPNYVLKYYDDVSREKCLELIEKADVVIYGSAPFGLIKDRLKSKKLTLCYSERIFKSNGGMKNFLRGIKYWCRYSWCKNAYMLCASAYAASDYYRVFCFKDKTYKWGYFPKVKHYEDFDRIVELKHPASILWVARLIEWKHPELPIWVAKCLKDEGYTFELNMIGNGVMKNSLYKMISDNGLQDCVHMLGAMKPDEVRTHMEQSQIFLLTSDRNEGWGAVINESMNSGCAVVASNAIGSVPYLILDERNGLIFEDGDFESLYTAVKRLLNAPLLCAEYGKAAYKTITKEWNADVAVERVFDLISSLNNGKVFDKYTSGPCSKDCALL